MTNAPGSDTSLQMAVFEALQTCLHHRWYGAPGSSRALPTINLSDSQFNDVRSIIRETIPDAEEVEVQLAVAHLLLVEVTRYVDKDRIASAVPASRGNQLFGAFTDQSLSRDVLCAATRLRAKSHGSAPVLLSKVRQDLATVFVEVGCRLEYDYFDGLAVRTGVVVQLMMSDPPSALI